MQRLALLVLFSGLLASCGGGDDDPTEVYASMGSLQCSGGGISLAALASKLSGAGVQVLSASCGDDGMPKPAMCGVPDGRIGIFSVHASQLQAATQLGFAALASLPSATRIPCP